MKKIFSSLPVKLLIGIVIGIIFGQIFPENVMSVVVPLKNILGQVINFVVPLIVIGFIAPSITKLGNNASRMLGVALMVAYTSSVLAALLSMGAGYAIIPNLPVVSEIEGLKELPERCFWSDYSADYECHECSCIFHFNRTCGNLDKSKDDHYYFR